MNASYNQHKGLWNLTIIFVSCFLFIFTLLQSKNRPPPEEVYTLHRKLAGAYMLCIKLGAVIRSRNMLESVVANHKFEDGKPNPITRK